MVRRPPNEGKSPTFTFLIPPQCQSKTIRPSRLRLHPRLLRHHLVLPPRPSSFVRSSPSAVHPLPTFTLVSTIVKSPLLADDMLLLLWPLMAFIFLAEAARGCYDGWPTAPRQSCSSTPFPRIPPTLQCRGLATAPRPTTRRRRRATPTTKSLSLTLHTPLFRSTDQPIPVSCPMPMTLVSSCRRVPIVFTIHR